MAKKSEAKPTAGTPGRKAAEKENSLARRTGEGRGEGAVPRPSDGRGIKGEGRPSVLLDTRVVYCGGPCRTGHHYYHLDRHASHYVKVMLDQIFGENN